MKNITNASASELIKNIVICAMFAAILTVCAWVSIPLPWGVPINLAHLAVFTAAGIIGIRNATFSTALYVIIGAIGVPVFSHFSGGWEVLTGATGGYIIGYVFTAFITAYLIKKWNGHADSASVSDKTDTIAKSRRSNVAAAMIIGMVCTYIPGAIWFAVVMKCSPLYAVVVCTVPYMFGDGVKIVAAMELTHRVAPLYRKMLGTARA